MKNHGGFKVRKSIHLVAGAPIKARHKQVIADMIANGETERRDLPKLPHCGRLTRYVIESREQINPRTERIYVRIINAMTSLRVLDVM